MEDFTRDQERVNANIHFIGVAIGIVAIPVLLWSVWRAPQSTGYDLIGAAVYGLGFIMVFAFSALYHFFSRPSLKDAFEIWDHIGIYFMIAGTYTPLVIAYAQPEDRNWMLLGLWLLAGFGSVFKFFFPARFRTVSMLIYVAMGLLFVIAPASFKNALPAQQFWWIIAGAMVYCAGLLFYMWAFFRHHHAVWHGFVLLGALCHYVAIFLMFY